MFVEDAVNLALAWQGILDVYIPCHEVFKNKARECLVGIIPPGQRLEDDRVGFSCRVPSTSWPAVSVSGAARRSNRWPLATIRGFPWVDSE